MPSFGISMKWDGNLKFKGKGAFGAEMVTDASKKAGGTEDGFKPTELVLFGIAGCTGVDIVRILEKQRQELSSFEIEVTGHHNDDYPKPIHTVEIKYLLTGKNLQPSKVEKAIEISESKYCMVSQTVKNPGDVTTSYEIIEE